METFLSFKQKRLHPIFQKFPEIEDSIFCWCPRFANVAGNAVISTTILQKQVLLLSTCLEKEYDAEIWLIV